MAANDYKKEKSKPKGKSTPRAGATAMAKLMNSKVTSPAPKGGTSKGR